MGSSTTPWIAERALLLRLYRAADQSRGPEQENFAAFAKLLTKRLEGVPAENVDLRGITLTGYDIKAREPAGGGDEVGAHALKGNLPGAVQKAVVRAMTSNRDLEKLVLKQNSQAIDILTNTVYDLLRSGELCKCRGGNIYADRCCQSAPAASIVKKGVGRS